LCNLAQDEHSSACSLPERIDAEWSRGESNPRPGSAKGGETKDLQGLAVDGGAQSGAGGADSPPPDPDLARIAAAWPGLPEAIRRAVLALIDSAGE